MGLRVKRGTLGLMIEKYIKILKNQLRHYVENKRSKLCIIHKSFGTLFQSRKRLVIRVGKKYLPQNYAWIIKNKSW